MAQTVNNRVSKNETDRKKSNMMVGKSVVTTREVPSNPLKVNSYTQEPVAATLQKLIGAPAATGPN
jgi:hypothetical protein